MIGGTGGKLGGVISGMLLVISGFLPWVGNGPGSSMPGMELAAALRTSAGLPEGAAKIGLGVIMVAVIGVIQLITVLGEGLVVVVVRFLGGLVVSLGLVLAALAVPSIEWGAGYFSALVGGIVGMSFGAWSLVELNRKEV